MKYLLTLLAAVLFIFSTTSCERCSTCIVKDDDGSKIYDYPETCGNKEAIDDYKAVCEAQYGDYGFECECSDD